MYRIVADKISVMPLIIVNDKLRTSTPYANHIICPAVLVILQPKEISFVDFDFHDLITCGNNAAATSTPAKKPIISAFIY